MNTTIDLVCLPHLFAGARHTAGSVPESMVHSPDTKCGLVLPLALRPTKGAGITCCAMQGTALAVILSQFNAERYVSRLYRALTPREALQIADDLSTLAKRIHAEILNHMDREDVEEKRSVGVRVPTSPNGHTTHHWHFPRVSVRQSIDLLHAGATWYRAVADRGFGVIHEWR